MEPVKMWGIFSKLSKEWRKTATKAKIFVWTFYSNKVILFLVKNKFPEQISIQLRSEKQKTSRHVWEINSHRKNPETQLHFCFLNSTFTYSPDKHAYMWQINFGRWDIQSLDMPCVFPEMAQLLPVVTMTVKRQMTASDSKAGLEEMPLCHLLFHFPFWMRGWF